MAEVHGPDTARKQVDQVQIGNAVILDDTLAVPGEEMRRVDERQILLQLQAGQIQSFRPIEDAVIVEERILELPALECRQLHIEAILLLQGLALIMPTHRKPAALQNHALELLNAVIQLRPGIPEILVELLVDLLQRHCVNNHSRSVACDCKDNQKWPSQATVGRLYRRHYTSPRLIISEANAAAECTPNFA